MRLDPNVSLESIIATLETQIPAGLAAATLQPQVATQSPGSSILGGRGQTQGADSNL